MPWTKSTQWEIVGQRQTANLRTVAAAGAGGDSAAVPLCDSRFPFRPTAKRVHQTTRGSVCSGKLLIEQTRSASAPFGRQRSGGGPRMEPSSASTSATATSAAEARSVRWDQFYREHLNPYVNFHRPLRRTQSRHRSQRQAPPESTRVGPHRFEILQEAPDGESCLRPGITFAELERSPTSIRHRSRTCHAAGQTQTARPSERKTDCMRRHAFRASRWSAAGSLSRSGENPKPPLEEKPNEFARLPRLPGPARGHKKPPERSLSPTSSQSPFRLILR